jgi:tetratricopeptide (TPR) repeat protein
LHARDGESIYQSAGNQIFYQHQRAAEPTAPCDILPRDTAGFTGRDRELRALFHTVVQRPEARSIVPLYAIDGMPGVGKTAFAVHAGHMLQEHFPDAQFHIDLHAHAIGQRPDDPSDALFRLISADGVRPAEIPHSLDDRAALWRKRMARRRALVILDNAESRRQVEPLLPGAGRSLVMITSRSRLTGLVAHQAPVNLTLEPLPPEDATALFATLANRHLEPDEALAVEKLMRLCGYLPLAICLLATPLRLEAQWPIASVIRELIEARHHLSAMGAEDVTVEATFGLSYGRLPAHLRRFFRRLGLHPGADLDQYSAAALGGIRPDEARHCLTVLYDNHLLDQPTFGRYRMHDLVRQYAAMLAESDKVDQRSRAVAGLLDYYRRAAELACRFLSGPGDHPVHAGDDLPPIRSRREAVTWMRIELLNLFAAASEPPASRGDGVLPALAAAMAPYLRLAGPWDRGIVLHQAAAASAARTGDRHAEAGALRALGTLSQCVGDFAAADHVLRQALDLYQHVEDHHGVAETQTRLANLRWRAGRYDEATNLLRMALDTFRALGARHGQAEALKEMGIVLWATGELVGALRVFREALAVHEDLGDRHGLAGTLQQIGGLQQLVDGYPAAIATQRRALEIHRDLGDLYGEAMSLNYLGVALCYAGDHTASRSVLTRALVIHRELGYRVGEANALNYLGVIHCRTGQFPTAQQLLSEALSIYERLGDPLGQADTLNQLGVVARMSGRFDASEAMHQQALTRFRECADATGEAEVLNAIGDLRLAEDRPSEALDRYEQALELAREAPIPLAEANALHGLARCTKRLGDARKAAELLGVAQGIYDRIGVSQTTSDCPR